MNKSKIFSKISLLAVLIFIICGKIYFYKNDKQPLVVNNTTENINIQNSTTTIAATALALRTNDEWKKILTPDQYNVLRESGTERPNTSPLLHESRKGTFVTADCGEPVFRSEQKFDSGTGWPSFWAPINGSIELKADNSLFTSRTEVVSKICKSHLGHVFHDAPQTPTGDRYCMNGVALIFVPDNDSVTTVNTLDDLASTTKSNDLTVTIKKNVSYSVSSTTLSLIDNGKTTQTLTLNDEGLGALNILPSNDVPPFITDKDLNFDGFNDVGVLDGTGYGGVNYFYDFYLFNPSINTLEKNKVLSEFVLTSTNSAKKQITSTYKSGPEYVTDIYQWNGSTYLKK